MIRKNISNAPQIIYEVDLNLDNQKLIETIQNHRKLYPQGEESNVHAWMSSYKTHRINNNFDPFIEKILQAVDDVRKSDLDNFCNLSKINYNVTDFWALIYDDGDYTDEHNHFPCTWALAYYAYADNDSSPIKFFFSKYKSLRIQPKSGMLLLWPGSLPHSVPHTRGKRIAVSANLTVRDFVK